MPSDKSLYLSIGRQAVAPSGHEAASRAAPLSTATSSNSTTSSHGGTPRAAQRAALLPPADAAPLPLGAGAPPVAGMLGAAPARAPQEFNMRRFWTIMQMN